MHIDLLAPVHGLVGIVLVFILVSAIIARLRSRKAAKIFGGPPTPQRRSVVRRRNSGYRVVGSVVGGLLIVGFLTIASMHPAVTVETPIEFREDAEICYVFDLSRSMLASDDPSSPTRFMRSKEIVKELRSRLSSIPSCIGGFTNYAVLHLPATPNQATFDAVLSKSVAIQEPPPNIVDAPTSLEAIGDIANDRFFSLSSRKRVLVLLADGEGEPVDPAEIRTALQENKVELIIVWMWKSGEQVFAADGRAETYRTDPGTARTIHTFGTSVGATVFQENEMDSVVQAIRDRIGNGPSALEGQWQEKHSLAPLFVLAAFVVALFWFFRTKT